METKANQGGKTMTIEELQQQLLLAQSDLADAMEAIGDTLAQVSAECAAFGDAWAGADAEVTRAEAGVNALARQVDDLRKLAGVADKATR